MPHTQFDSETSARTHSTSDNVNSGRLAPVSSKPVRFAINTCRHGCGEDETLNPAGAVDALVFRFVHPEQTKKTWIASVSVPKCLCICALIHITLSAEVTPTQGWSLENAGKKITVLEGGKHDFFFLLYFLNTLNI